MEHCTEGLPRMGKDMGLGRFVTPMGLVMRDNGDKMRLKVRASLQPKDSHFKASSEGINLFEGRLVSTRRDSVRSMKVSSKNSLIMAKEN